jgi:cytochrome c-type biogenesis protein CcmH/NrfF
MLLLLAAIKQNKQTTSTTKNNTPNKRDTLKERALNDTTRCYSYENTGTTKDRAIVTKDMSIEVGNITEEDKLNT